MAKRKKQVEVGQTDSNASTVLFSGSESLATVSPVASGPTLNILFNLHSYVPEQMSGAEVMAHRMARYLTQCGHNITVLTKWGDKVFDGVRVKHWGDVMATSPEIVDLWKSADVVVTHLGQTGDSCNKCKDFGKPLVHLIHNTFEMLFVRAKVANSYVVYNSQWAKDTLRYAQESIIVNPPVDYREFAGVDRKKAEYVTLVNVNENKGGRIFPEIAKKLPGISFLGVDGGYEQQIRDMSVKNIRYVPQHPDIKDILKQTRILLMPSNYESWGLIAIEAAACGIPVIANPTPGLKSSLGDAGIWVEREDVDGWAREITRLQDAKAYAEASAKSLDRAKELDPLPQLEAMEKFLQWIHKQPYQ